MSGTGPDRVITQIFVGFFMMLALGGRVVLSDSWPSGLAIDEVFADLEAQSLLRENYTRSQLRNERIYARIASISGLGPRILMARLRL